MDRKKKEEKEEKITRKKINKRIEGKLKKIKLFFG